MMNNTYTEMKDSGVAWIGDIPLHWTLTKMKCFLYNKSVKGYPQEQVLSLYREFGVIPKDSRNDNHNVTSEDTAAYKYVEAGDLVINKMKAWQGSLGVSEYTGIVSPAYYVCGFKSKNANKHYFHYMLRSKNYAQEFECLSTGMRIGQWDLGIDDFMRVPAILPPLPEQTAIAAYLDEKCGTIDEIIAEAKASIEEYKAWKSSVIFEAVTKGLDPHAEMKDSGVEWIGKVPRHWKKTPVKSIARFINGYAFSSDLLIPNALFPVIRIGDILDNGSVNFKHALGIDELINNLEGFTIQKNDVLIAMSGATTGKVCVITEAPPKAFINQRVGIVRSFKHSKYLYYCLSTDIFKEYVLLLSAGSAQPNLSTAGIKNYQIICPPDNEIESITRYLDEKCAAIDGIIAEKEALIADMETYKKSLIFETVTGKRKVC